MFIRMAKQTEEKEKKVLTNADALESEGMAEIYDATVDAYRQVPKEHAEKMRQKFEVNKSSQK